MDRVKRVMAKGGAEEMVLLDSQIAALSKMTLAPPHTHTIAPAPTVTLPDKLPEDATADEIKTHMDKVRRQIDADMAHMDALIKRLEGLQGDRLFESDLYQSCRELLYTRYARGLTPLSTTEATSLKQIQHLARLTINQYQAANGTLPAFVAPTFGQFPNMF